VNRAQRRYLDATLRPGARGRIHTRPTSWALDDAKWFRANRDRSHRVRPRLVNEWFASPGDASGLDRVAVRQIEPGFRVRFPFEIPFSPCAEYVREASKEEDGASILFDLAMRGGDCRCDVLVALLDRQKIPNARVH
jgi:hypothetical protein